LQTDDGSGTTKKKSAQAEASRAKEMFENEVKKKRPSLGRPPLPRRENSNSSNMTRNNDDSASVGSTSSLRDRVLASSLDCTQIELDVARCTWHLLTGTQRLQRLQMEHKRQRKIARLIRRKQRRLANLINLTLVQSYRRLAPTRSQHDNTLRYYQGYHDVACVVLSTLSGSTPVRLRASASERLDTLRGVAEASGLDAPAAVLLQISQSHLRDCMRANFASLQAALRLSLLPLIAYFDPPVHQFLMECEMEPFFALSWVITWFSHVIRDTELVKQLFDFFLVSHPLMPIYLAVAMVCHPLNREEVLQTECDFSMVHQVLSGLPRNSSMVGWKYRPGDGYVSDDEEDIDDESSLGHLDSQSSVDTDFLLYEEAIKCIGGGDAAAAEAVSTVSSCISSLFEARVPFQELIANAITYMDRMPPRNLISLASRYYGRDAVRSMLEETSGITFFSTPPEWTRASVAKSDRMLQSEFRQRQSTSSDSLSKDDASSESITSRNEEELKSVLTGDRARALAALAAGFGAGDDAERYRRLQRKRMLRGAALAVVFGVAIGFYVQYRDSNTTKSTDLAVCQSERQTFSQVMLATSSLPQADVELIASAVAVNNNGGSSMGAPSLKLHSTALIFADSGESHRMAGLSLRTLPTINVLLVLLLQTLLKETLTLGERIGKIGKDVMVPPFKSVAKNYRRIVFERKRRIAAYNNRDEERQINVPPENEPYPDQIFLLYLIRNGVEHGAAQMKGAVNAAFVHYFQLFARGLRESVVSGARDPDDDAFQNKKRVSVSLQRPRFQAFDVLNKEFKPLDLGRLTRPIAHNLQTVVKNLGSDLKRLHKIHLSNLADFHRKQMERLSEMARTQAATNLGKTVKKAVASSGLQNAIRGATFATRYAPGTSKAMVKRDNRKSKIGGHGNL
jgi:Rab-GTPase-TBC domain